MDIAQIISLVAAAGGGVGLSKVLHLFRPRGETMVRDLKNSGVFDIRSEVAKFGEELISQTRMLSRIENNSKMAAHRLDGRIDAHDERISDLEEFRRRIEERERPR